MEYMLSIYAEEQDPGDVPKEEMDKYMGAWFQFDQDLRAAVKVVHGSALQPTATATTVRHKGGKPITSDGPFAETKEQLGGYYIIDAPNLDVATEWAGKMPNLTYGGSVEVRPLMVFE